MREQRIKRGGRAHEAWGWEGGGNTSTTDAAVNAKATAWEEQDPLLNTWWRVFKEGRSDAVL